MNLISCLSETRHCCELLGNHSVEDSRENTVRHVQIYKLLVIFALKSKISILSKP